MGNKKNSVSNAPCSSVSGSKKKTKVIPAVPDRKTFSFVKDDIKELSENKYYRFHENSEFISHIVIPHDGSIPQKAFQFELPKSDDPEDPTWKPIENPTEITRYGKGFYQAQMLDGTQVYATRSYQFKDENDNEYTFVPFSPPPKRSKEPFWGSTKLVPIFNEKGKKEVKHRYKGLLANPVILGDRVLEIDPPSVPVRQAVTTRKPSQKKVMGNKSARDEIEFYYEELKTLLTPEMQDIFEVALAARTRRDKDHPNEPTNRRRYPEWLHAEGYSLTPLSMEPQRADNLGAAQAWANTAMMVLEDVVKWYALHCPETYCTIKPKFLMLLDTPLIEKIDFEVRVGLKDKFLCFIQHIEPLRTKYPVKMKASDTTQIVKVSQAMLTGEKPFLTTTVQPLQASSKVSSGINAKKKQIPSTTTDGKSTMQKQAVRDRQTSTPSVGTHGIFTKPGHSYNLRTRVPATPRNASTQCK